MTSTEGKDYGEVIACIRVDVRSIQTGRKIQRARRQANVLASDWFLFRPARLSGVLV